MQQGLGEPALTAAWLRAAFVALGGSVALPGGAFADAFGQKRAYLLGLTGTLAAGAMFLVGDLRALWPLALYAGVMFGLSSVGGQSYLMGAVPRESLGLATAGYFMSGTLGGALGNYAGGAVADTHPRLGFAYLGGTILVGEALLLAVAVVALPALPRPAVARSLKVLLGGYREVLRRPGVTPLLALRYLPTFYWGCVTLLLPLLIFHAAGTKRAVGQYSSLSLVVAAACQLLAGRWIDRRGPRPVVLTAIALVTTSAALLALSLGSLAGIYAFGILGAAAAWSLSITMPGLVNDLAPEAEKSRLLGATHLAWSAGLVSGSLVAGAFAETRPALPLQLSALLCAMGILCALLLFRGRLAAEVAEGRNGGEDERKSGRGDGKTAR